MTELRKTPNDAWLLTRLSTTYYEERNYKKALQISRKAYHKAPNDSLVIWDYAGCLDMLGRKKLAIFMYTKILKMKFKDVAIEGKRWGLELLNDCKYRVGLCYADIGNRKKASFWLIEHIKGRKTGIRSIYKLRDVRKKLIAITA
jgi:tetratricopeptide (TPR) repeat protein